MEKLFIIKIGGNIIDDEIKIAQFLKEFALINEHKILVHGGGKLATALAKKLGIEQTIIDGRRVTDAQTLQIATMVYAGAINKNIVAMLQSNNSNALGLTGADANLLVAHKRVIQKIDYGFVGDIDKVNIDFVNLILQQNITLVVAPITHDANGTLLNTNADTIASEIAKAVSAIYDVSLSYCF